MNTKEREVIDRIDGVIKIIGSLRPKNPADISVIFSNNKIATEAAKALTNAIGCWRCKDWDGVASYLTSAEQSVKE